MTPIDQPAPFPPPGYARWRQGPHDVVAREPVREVVRAALAESGGLHAWAARHRERILTTGRGEVFAIELGPARAAVRHYHRGGWMATLLDDRYFDSPPRPFAELAVSERLRRAGVPTPQILAAVVTAARPGYRADLATEWLEPGHDLTALLAPNRYPPADRAAGLAAAGRAVGHAHRAGLDHADLNLSNIFVQPRTGGKWAAALLDLDRARLLDPDSRDFKKKTFAASTARLSGPGARAA